MASSPGLAQWSSRSSPLHHRSSPSQPAIESPITKSSPAPDTTSPVYPERMIRPLPKRRLRDRLSEEQSQALEIPTDPQNQQQGNQQNAPLFSYPFPPAVERKEGEPYIDSPDGHPWERTPRSPPRPQRSSVQAAQRLRAQRHNSGGGAKAPPPSMDSGASSVEGDESFETNNKKKRKIPQSNSSGISPSVGISTAHHSSLSAEMANMGLSPRDVDGGLAEDGEGVVGSYYGTGAAVPPLGSPGSPSVVNGNTIPAGRAKLGRNGRGTLERRPLTTSTNGANYRGVSPTSGARRRGAGLVSPKSVSAQQPMNVPPNIIGSAIARSKESPYSPNSPADLKSPQNENTSVIDSSKPPTGPFTFSRQPPTDTPWPGQGPYAMDNAYPVPGQYPDTKRGPGPAPPAPASTAQLQQQGSTSSHQSTQGQQPQQGQPKKTRPRRPGRVYDLAARQRQLNQQYANMHNPPRRDEVWICEFCEYKAIYGVPPRALIRSYEIKDRKEQKRQAERRRLLEKAKIKGRKGKKANKANNSNAQGTNNPNANNAAVGTDARTSAAAQQAMQNAKNNFAHQAAEFQKREMLRAHAQMDRARELEQQRQMQQQGGHPGQQGQAIGGAQRLHHEDDVLDEYDDDEGEVYVDEEGYEGYYDEDEGGDTEEYYGEEGDSPIMEHGHHHHHGHDHHDHHHHHHSHPHPHPHPHQVPPAPPITARMSAGPKDKARKLDSDPAVTAGVVPAGVPTHQRGPVLEI